MSGLLHLPVRVDNGSHIQENDLDLINRHALEELTADEIYTFSGYCSNDRLDSYFTRMDSATTLRNYAQDLREGVPLQEGHDITKNPFGRSYDGKITSIDTDEMTVNAVRGSWYIKKGLNINGVSTDDRISAIRAGIIKDMSVGFGGNSLWFKCGTCNRNMFDSDCPHIPGLEDEEGNITFAWIMDGRLREVSTVYRGATPEAYIDKARSYVSQGELPEMSIQKLENRYQVRFERNGKPFFMPKKEGQELDILEQVRTAIKEGQLEKSAIYAALQEEGEEYRHPEDVQLRNELGENASVEGVKQLKAEAEQGRQYMADLVDQAVKARIRVQGDTFNAESYKLMLARSGDMEFIKDEIASYEEQAKQKFPAGRQTEKEKLQTHENTSVTTEKENAEENIFG